MRNMTAVAVVLAASLLIGQGCKKEQAPADVPQPTTQASSNDIGRRIALSILSDVPPEMVNDVIDSLKDMELSKSLAPEKHMQTCFLTTKDKVCFCMIQAGTPPTVQLVLTTTNADHPVRLADITKHYGKPDRVEAEATVGGWVNYYYGSVKLGTKPPEEALVTNLTIPGDLMIAISSEIKSRKATTAATRSTPTPP
jgi:hypothetical protein